MSMRNYDDDQSQEQPIEKPKPEMHIFAKQVCLLGLLTCLSVGVALIAKQNILLKLLGLVITGFFGWLTIRLVFFVKTK